jgi:hypothetical protein
MDVSDKIKYIIERILEREDRWKALYMAVWGYSYYLDGLKREHPELWDQTIALGLPGSKKKQHLYKPSWLHSILTSSDADITILHLVVLFVLLEELLNESSLIFFNKRLDTGYLKQLKIFLGENETKDILSEPEEKELFLAKATRNCFVHNGSKIDQTWMEAYQLARGIPSIEKIGDDVKSAFESILHQVEDWHEIVIKITKKLEEKIKEKQ